MKLICVLASSLFFLLPPAAQTETFQGKVIAIKDGDTIEVLKSGKAIRIRLSGIDCPEKTQAYGNKAKEYTSELIFGKIISVKEHEIDLYGRTIADVFLEDGTLLNKRLIEAGLAWHYKRYSKDEELSKAELRARKDKIGLWQDSYPIAPWDYRKQAKTPIKSEHR